MTDSSVGNGADGSNRPAQKVAQLGTSTKGGSNIKGGRESVNDARVNAPGIDKVFRKMGEALDKKKRELAGNETNLVII